MSEPREEQGMEERTYVVEGMTCEHCVRAVSEEVSKVVGVVAVDVDLPTKRVQVSGVDVDDAAVVAAVEEAGYEAVAGAGS
jgi:copper chaperone CopZ